MKEQTVQTSPAERTASDSFSVTTASASQQAQTASQEHLSQTVPHSQSVTQLPQQPLQTASYSDEDEEQDSEETAAQPLYEYFSLTVDKGQSLIRIDKYLATHIEGASRSRVKQALEAGYVRVGEDTVKPNYKVKPLDHITVSLPYQLREYELVPEEMPLDIRYEDEDVLVVNKPAGLVVHPAHGHYNGTLVNGLAWYLGKTAEQMQEGDERQGMLVHRIDKDTSGTLLVAKNDRAQMLLARQFHDHTVERVYTAIVWGDFDEDEGTVDTYIGRDPSERQRFAVCEEGVEGGKHAVTHYKVIERLGYVTVLECRLETGRTHQIRVHMNHIGHPLFSDAKYGGDRILKGTLYSKYKQFIDNCFRILPRQALHAGIIGFIHPRTKEKVVVKSELPQDMVQVLEKFRKFVQARRYEQ